MSKELWDRYFSILKSGLDLEPADVAWCMKQILDGKADNELIKNFLLALKAKGETSEDVVSKCDIVVDSPPGITSASTELRSWRVLTCTVSAPRLCNISSCTANAPCNAKMPTFISTTRLSTHQTQSS